jgi:hypothetical protein
VGTSYAHNNIANVVRFLGHAANAPDDYDQVISRPELPASANATMPEYRNTLAVSLHHHCLARTGLGDLALVAPGARHALRLYHSLLSRSGRDSCETACYHVVLARPAGLGSLGLSAVQAAVDTEAVIGLLHKAVVMGFRDFTLFRSEAALEPVRDCAKFRLLMVDLVFLAKAFAPDG